MINARKPVLVAVAIAIACVLFPLVSYVLADEEYEELVRAKPVTKSEVERLLFLYFSKEIDIKKSSWGKSYPIQPGDVCVRYLILGYKPIDIVFNHEKRVKVVFPSYE